MPEKRTQSSAVEIKNAFIAVYADGLYIEGSNGNERPKNYKFNGLFPSITGQNKPKA